MYADYNLITHDNINYTVDMLRLKTTLTYSTFTKLEFHLKTAYNKLLKNEYMSGGISDFKYNYNIELVEGRSYWFGFLHNSELINNSHSMQNEKTEYNFTLEFNPNKIPFSGLLKYIISLSNNWIVKSLDIAMDVKVNIMDLCGFDKGRKKDFRLFSCGGDDRTYYIGRTNNRVKIYNKKIESNLEYDLTRIEITSKLDLKVQNVLSYNYDIKLPELYLNDYLYSFKDYEDKTLLAILYAVQSRI